MPSLCRIRWIPILMVAVSPVALTSCGVESEPASEISGPSPSPAPVNQSRVLPLSAFSPSRGETASHGARLPRVRVCGGCTMNSGTLLRSS